VECILIVMYESIITRNLDVLLTQQIVTGNKTGIFSFIF